MVVPCTVFVAASVAESTSWTKALAVGTLGHGSYYRAGVTLAETTGIDNKYFYLCINI